MALSEIEQTAFIISRQEAVQYLIPHPRTLEELQEVSPATYRALRAAHTVSEIMGDKALLVGGLGCASYTGWAYRESRDADFLVSYDDFRILMERTKEYQIHSDGTTARIVVNGAAVDFFVYWPKQKQAVIAPGHFPDIPTDLPYPLCGENGFLYGLPMTLAPLPVLRKMKQSDSEDRQKGLHDLRMLESLSFP